ncbi:hypothetical protein CJF42_01705 [Pseudoalteromonas sp. NBT06-2]|uniref:copper chaperone PCu(A)C n=1 Tax=Pseudoalteromonas sp. NBT06-2 TaxID=2025950 RepID=UPI000BA4FB39|nr:copper chaperone PCu(A)C [Pseudoalteromonas sp. NBT06-2]PAJ75979.1 hypothetical protein CJF42_01705 [Pseudoalteromonas sp. NBT06-2]
MRFLVFISAFCIFYINSAIAHTTLIDVQVRSFIPGASNSVAYFTLDNDTKDIRTLVSAEVEGIKRVEIHQHKFINGMMKMSRLHSLDINAYHQVHFRPGGLHLMLFEPIQFPKPGDKIKLTLHFTKGESISIQADVIKLGEEKQNHSHH